MVFIEKPVHAIREWYGQFERPLSSLSLILGFVFDIVTLKRLDTLWENSWILGHLVIVGIFIILINVKESEDGDERDPSKAHFWYVNILQFFFGGLLSTYLVFYFRSADIFVSWPFIAILGFAFLANESLKRHYIRLSFQISLFFLSIYSFMIFLLPILLHRIGLWIFLLSGLLSLLLIGGFMAVLFFCTNYFAKNKSNKIELESFWKRKSTRENTKENQRESQRTIMFSGLSILGIWVLMNFLYFTNLIPPIPLSLKDAAVYHSIAKNGEGNYQVTYEDAGWRSYLELFPDFHKKPEDTVYAYSAVFSPKGLNITIVHEWQYFNEESREWDTINTIELPVIGGRDGGFRTYSARSDLKAGKWRVNIKTEQGQTIGHLRFNIVLGELEPLLFFGVKE